MEIQIDPEIASSLEKIAARKAIIKGLDLEFGLLGMMGGEVDSNTRVKIIAEANAAARMNTSGKEVMLDRGKAIALRDEHNRKYGEGSFAQDYSNYKSGMEARSSTEINEIVVNAGVKAAEKLFGDPDPWFVLE